MSDRAMEPAVMRGRLARRVALGGGLLGAFASAYLLIDYLGGPGICLTGGGCDQVRLSAFAYPLGVPLPLIGLIFYTVATAALLVGMSRPRLLGLPVSAALLGWAAVGAAASVVLTAIEAFVIDAFCSWCLVQAAASLVLLVGVAWLARGRSALTETPSRGTARARRAAASRLVDERRGVLRFTAASGGILAVAFAALLAIPALDAPVQAGGPTAAADRPVLGDGPVAVTVFSDFECPACAAAAPALTDLADRGATVTYRYFPLTAIHNNALPAARAAEAAHLQGRFWEMHDLLFARQSTWAGAPAEQAAAVFEQLAVQAGLDVERWRSDLGDAERIVRADLAEAERLALPGTPAIFVGGTRYEGPLTLEGLLAALASGG